MAARLPLLTLFCLLLAACSSSTTRTAGCPSPTVLCGGVCVDVQKSADHCGGCGIPCTGPET